MQLPLLFFCIGKLHGSLTCSITAQHLDTVFNILHIYTGTPKQQAGEKPTWFLFLYNKGHISMSVLWLGFSVITQYTKIQTKIKPLPIHHKFADLQYLLQLLLFLWCLACFSSMFQCSMGKKRSAHTVERGNLVQIQLKEDKYEEKNCFRKRIKHVWSVHKVLWKDLLDDCLCISTVLHE
jgi:hypothetical protein